jgi:hypothetical protein
MCSFDTVIHPCPFLGDWVRTDQTRADCAGEHCCDLQQICPLDAQFNEASAPRPTQQRQVDLRGWAGAPN